MKVARYLVLTGSVGLAISFAAAPAASAHVSPGPQRVALRGSLTPALERQHPAGSVPANSTVKFDLVLKLRNAAGARAFLRKISTEPVHARHYLTDAQWIARYGATSAEVSRAKSWLRSQGFRVGNVPSDRIFVSARGPAFRVEHAFGVQLGYYIVNGHRVRLAKGALSIPSSLAGTITGVVGVNQFLQTNDLAVQGTSKPVKPAQEPAPPAAFVNPEPCSAYWGQKTDTTDSGNLYAPYTSPLPYDICGYKPAQLRGGYGINPTTADGTGVGIAIVDAYDSPTLLSDAQRYFRMNDHAHPLSSAQFFNAEPASVDLQSECGGGGWYDEQALDVESSHSMAPGAAILFVGAQDCLDASLLASEQVAVTSGASVVSNSWGGVLGDLLEDNAAKTAFDNTFLLAGATGVSVLFSTGDTGDNFADFGITAPDYPPSSPFVTAVGGTTLEVNASNARIAEYGWSTAKQLLCARRRTTNCGSATSPAGTLNFQSAGTGGTSYAYLQPYYQAGVVPAELALRNEALFGPVPLRVIPDISMDGDAQSGMLIGLTETFPKGVHFGEFKEGGTSLSSPLLAGVVADAVQQAGMPLGFLNPELYKAFTATPTAFNDIMPPANANSAAVIRVDYANTVNATSGYVVSLRAIDYQGPETYCDGAGICRTGPVALSTAAGFDSMTGLGSVGADFVAALSKF